MITIEAALAAQHDELSSILAGLGEDDWSRGAPSCPGWSVADVVMHLSQTDALGVASLNDQLPELATSFAGPGSSPSDVDAGAEAAVAAARGLPNDEVRNLWEANAEAVRDGLAVADPHKRVRWIAGMLSVRTLATTRLAESWIHTGDVAEALGVERTHDERLWHIARLAWRTIPYAFERADRAAPSPVAFELRGPSGERWSLTPDDPATTTVEGDALDLCLVAARRRKPHETSLDATGPDAEAVLDLVRTYA